MVHPNTTMMRRLQMLIDWLVYGI